MMDKIIIPIQSISDVITNSSSELFCTIFSDEHLNDIYELLTNIIGKNYDSEDSISIRLRNKEDKDDCFENYPDNWIEIDLSYDYFKMSHILKIGLEAILKDQFKNKFEITYD